MMPGPPDPPPRPHRLSDREAFDYLEAHRQLDELELQLEADAMAVMRRIAKFRELLARRAPQ